MKRTAIVHSRLLVQAVAGTLFALCVALTGNAIAQSFTPVSSVISMSLLRPSSLERNRIIYHENYGRGIWSIKPDGTDPRELSDHGWFASFSPGGRKIAFSDYYDNGIRVMDADGSNPRKLTDFGTAPSWSPDESQIVFNAGGKIGSELRIWVMNADGTGLRQISDNPGYMPHWSPNGAKILYKHPLKSEVWVIDPDGSNERLVCTTARNAASWSSNGNKIIFTSSMDWRIWIMDADGRNRRPVSRSKGMHGRMNGDGDRIVFESVEGGLIVTTLDGTEQRISKYNTRE